MSVKLFVKDSERKPDPEPVKVNARTAVVVGLVGWTVALAVFLLAPATVPQGKSWWPVTCVFGIALGIFAWFKVGKR
jgi:hypothetical protein